MSVKVVFAPSNLRGAKVSKLLLEEGDAVTAGEVVAEIENDQEIFEYHAPESGFIIQVLVGVGQILTSRTRIFEVEVLDVLSEAKGVEQMAKRGLIESIKDAMRDTIRQEIDPKIVALRTEINGRFDKMDQRFDTLEKLVAGNSGNKPPSP